MALERVVAALARHYGPPPPLPAHLTDPFGIVLYESVAYLVDDERRAEVWKAFKQAVAPRSRAVVPSPRAVLDLDKGRLAEAIARGGMQPPRRAEKLRRAARLTLDFFGGDLKLLMEQPLPKIRRGLKRFPGIGEPGADKILLFTRMHPVLALESNGLRVLLRLGYGEDSGSYAATYRSVQEAMAPELKPDFDRLIAAHQLLRRHGQTLCTRGEPDCPACPFAATCPSSRAKGTVTARPRDTRR